MAPLADFRSPDRIKRVSVKRIKEVILPDRWVFPLKEAYERAKRTVDAPPGAVQLVPDVPDSEGGGGPVALDPAGGNVGRPSHQNLPNTEGPPRSFGPMSNAQTTTSTEDLSTPTSTPQSFGPPADGGNVVRRGRDGQKQNAGKNEVTSHEAIPLPDAPRGDAQASSSAGTPSSSSSTPKPMLGSGGHSGEVKLSKRQMTDVMFGPPVTGPLLTNRTKTVEWPREDYFGKPISAKSGRPPHFTIEQWVQLSQQQRHIQTDLYRMELEARAAGVDNTCVVAPSGGNVGAGKTVKPFALRCVRPKLSMVEFCCGENSRLGRREFAKRCRVWRITEKHDARTKAGRKVTLDAVAQAGPGLLWASMPCTGGCRWQIPNYKKGSAETRAKIDQHRRDFQLMWGARPLQRHGQCTRRGVGSLLSGPVIVSTGTTMP